MNITTKLVTSKTTIRERLLFGEAPSDDWRTGEHQVIDLLRAGGHITSPQAGVDEYTPEAAEIVDKAREFFGFPRSLGAAGRVQFPEGEIVMVLEPDIAHVLDMAQKLAESDRPPTAADAMLALEAIHTARRVKDEADG